MPKQFLLFLIVAGTLLPRPGAAQTDTAVQAAIHFADSVFHRTGFHYQQVEPDIPADIRAILVRFNNAIVANKQWFIDYKNAHAGQALPYNQRFGITADEYRRLQTLEQAPPQLAAVDTQQVTVIREAGYIRFKTDGDIHLLDYLQIDYKDGLVVYGGDTIPFVGRTSTTATSPYGEWSGFTWRLEKADAGSAIATSRVTARVVEINIGLPAQNPAQRSAQPSMQTPAQPSPNPIQPSPDKKVFLRVKYQDMQDGATTANLELVGFVY